MSAVLVGVAAMVAVEPSAAAVPGGRSSGQMDVLVTGLGRLEGHGFAPIEVNRRNQVIGVVTDPDVGMRPVLAQGGAVTDLAGGQTGVPRALGERGHVVVMRGTSDPFLWHDGVGTDVATKGLPTEAIDVNSWGQVLVRRSSDAGTQTAVWRAGSETPVSTGEQAVADRGTGAITDLGQVAASERTGAGGAAGYSWTPWGGVVPLGDLGGTTTLALAANVWGQVIGTSATADGVPRMFSWRNGEMVDLGTLGGEFTAPGMYPYAPVPAPTVGAFARHSVNARGQVIGVSQTAEGAFHGFVWQRGTMTDLGTPGDCTAVYPMAINDRGQVTGYCAGSADGLHAFFWDGGEVHDLGSTAEVGVPVDIDERGRIVSSATAADGSGPEALLLTVRR